MAPLPRSDTRLFLPYIFVLLQAFTWGLAFHSLSLNLDMPLPHPSSFQLPQASFEPNLYLYIYSIILIPVILLVHMTSVKWNRPSVPKHQHIKFSFWVITQKKEYKVFSLIIYKKWSAVLKLLPPVTGTVDRRDICCSPMRYIQSNSFIPEADTSEVLIPGSWGK